MRERPNGVCNAHGQVAYATSQTTVPLYNQRIANKYQKIDTAIIKDVGFDIPKLEGNEMTIHGDNKWRKLK